MDRTLTRSIDRFYLVRFPFQPRRRPVLDTGLSFSSGAAAPQGSQAPCQAQGDGVILGVRAIRCRPLPTPSRTFEPASAMPRLRPRRPAALAFSLTNTGSKLSLSYSNEIGFKLVDGLADPSRYAVASVGAAAAEPVFLLPGQWSKWSTVPPRRRGSQGIARIA